MSNSIRISQLDLFDQISPQDFVALVDSSSLTTYRTDVSAFLNIVASSGSVISSSWASQSFSATSASWASQSFSSVSSSWASQSFLSVSSSWAKQASTASYSITSSFSLVSITSSFAKSASFSTTSSFAITASFSDSSSFSTTASFANAAISVIGGTGFISGMVVTFAMQTPPSGWLECNGSEVLISTYPSLASSIYVDYTINSDAVYGYKTDGIGNKNNSGLYFKLPDLRAEFARGWDNGRNVDSGRSWASSQTSSLRSHTHYTLIDNSGWSNGGLSDGYSDANILNPPRNKRYVCRDGGSNNSGGNYNLSGLYFTSSLGEIRSASIGPTSPNSDSDNANETRPRNTILMYCIKI